MSDIARIVAAANFAAIKHKYQRRKDPEGTPYINHPLGVAHILTSVSSFTHLYIPPYRVKDLNKCPIKMYELWKFWYFSLFWDQSWKVNDFKVLMQTWNDYVVILVFFDVVRSKQSCSVSRMTLN